MTRIFTTAGPMCETIWVKSGSATVGADCALAVTAGTAVLAATAELRAGTLSVPDRELVNPRPK